MREQYPAPTNRIRAERPFTAKQCAISDRKMAADNEEPISDQEKVNYSLFTQS
jgi:hypothetical protein